jgi:RimJ/RimL family protein N-acetyltransferase
MPVAPDALRTARLVLRRPRPEDLEPLLALAGDPAFGRLCLRRPATRARVEERLAASRAAAWQKRAALAVAWQDVAGAPGS